MKLGQHFLRHGWVSQKVVDAVAVPEDGIVVEVGPGKGVLTERILAKKLSVIAIEKDVDLVSVLRAKFTDAIDSGALSLIAGDVRYCDWMDVVGDRPYVVIANIPYYLTNSLIRDLLTSNHPPTAMSLVVQKEVANRIVAKRENKESLLSLSVQLFGTPRYIQTIPRTLFSPKPSVDSAIITITDIAPPSQEVQDLFFSTIRTAFREKRKCVLKKFNDDQRLRGILVQHGVSDTDRAEDIPFSVWLAVACSAVDYRHTA